MAHTIVCKSCGAQRRTQQRNTKYCHKCRLLQNLEYLATRTRRCIEPNCNTEFAPVDTKDCYCGAHALGHSTLRGHCAWCHQDTAYLAKPDVPVCVRCVRTSAFRREI